MTERVIEAVSPEASVDDGALCDEFRGYAKEWVRAERDRVVRAQRAMRVRELALTRVLDERGQIDDSLAGVDGVSIRDVRRTVATARALEELPSIAAVAAEGRLSDAQLAQVVQLADPADEHDWASAAPRWLPADLAREARRRRTPTAADAAARRAARHLCWWWDHDRGMLALRGELPDIDGATVETVLTALVDGMRPARGHAWAPRDHRAADALVELCRAHTERDPNTVTAGARPHFVVEVPLAGPASVAGIPLPVGMVERLRAEAGLEPVLVGADGGRRAVGRTESALGAKTRRVVRQRDGHCRYPGCDRRVGLEVHHLWPVSWGGTDAIANLATVCSVHHAHLVPQGRLLLLGNPNHPAGLALLDRDDLPHLARLAAPARAGPDDP